MGYLYTEGEICVITGKTHGRREFETLNCAHCSALVRVILDGTGAHLYDTPFKCNRCRKPICRFCGTQRAGECNPIQEQIERSLRAGRWVERRDYRYKNYVRGAGR